MEMYALLLNLFVLGITQGTSVASNCFDKSEDSKDCDNGCVPGYYGDHCDLPCPSDCGSYKSNQPACSQESGYCLNGCKAGWYGDQCDRRCSGNCADDVCDRSTGDCLHCEGGFFGIHCKDKCNQNCEGDCARDGSCNCKHGFAGRVCEHECSDNCFGKQCHLEGSGTDTSVCSAGCVTGYTGVYCQDLCPDKCLKCNESGSCESDNHGSRSKRDENSNCLQYNSKDNKCDCCKTGWTGVTCSDRCPRCVQNSVIRKGVCTKKCENSTFGDHCEKSCSPNCAGSCNKTTGICNACIMNYHGDRCDKVCDRRCNISGCSQQNGNCNECPPDRYGNRCQRKWGDGCINGTCNRTNGSCECKEKWTGKKCDVTVSLGCSSSDAVTTENGDHECIGPCKNGYTGNSCRAYCLRCPAGCHKRSGNCPPQYIKVNHSLEAGLIAVGVILSLLVAIIIAELAVVLFRLHRRTPGTTNPDSVPMIANRN